MTDEQTVEERTTEEDRPRQTIRRMPDDQPDVGPYFPSGMSAPEAALAGATADMSDEQIAKLKGETPDDQQEAVE